MIKRTVYAWWLLAVLLVSWAPWLMGQMSVSGPLNAATMRITGQTIGDLLFADSTSTWARRAAVATNQVLTSAGVGAAPVYSNTPTLAGIKGVSGVLAHETGGALGRRLIGTRALTDATAAGLVDLTLSSVANEDDAVAVTVYYEVASSAGATRSVEVGWVTTAFTQDTTPNRVTATPSKFGNVQAKDAGMTTVTVTFDMSTTANVSTLRVAVDTDPNDSSTVFFIAWAHGGARMGQTNVTLASGVTAGS